MSRLRVHLDLNPVLFPIFTTKEVPPGVSFPTCPFQVVAPIVFDYLHISTPVFTPQS